MSQAAHEVGTRLGEYSVRRWLDRQSGSVLDWPTAVRHLPTLGLPVMVPKARRSRSLRPLGLVDELN